MQTFKFIRHTQKFMFIDSQLAPEQEAIIENLKGDFSGDHVFSEDVDTAIS